MEKDESEARKEALDDGLGWRSHLVRDALIELLRELWGTPDQRVDALNNHVWDPDPEKSNVKITPNHRLDFQQTDADIVFAPRIGDTKFQGLSEKKDIVETQDGVYTFMENHQFQIQCKTGLEELCTLAISETAVRFKENMETIKEFYTWGSMGIGGYSAPKSQAEDGSGPYVATSPITVLAEHSYKRQVD